MPLSTEAIGGYLELELPRFQAAGLRNANKFNSARSAFSYLVEQLAITKVWLPRYICNSMIDIFDGRNVELEYYGLSEDFSIAEDIKLTKDSVLLFVNYFGLCDLQVERVLAQFGEQNVVIDNSQALFSEASDALATIYSPRKFFGLPDGGLLCSRNPRIKEPENRDCTSGTRMDHLISRLTNSPEMAYQKYLEAERAIAELPVQGMSRLTERLLLSVDYEAAKKARARNFRYLQNGLGKHNQLDLSVDPNTVPLCYPFLPAVKTASRSALIKSRVFVPSYWPEVLSRVEEDSFEWNLVTNGLFLPCDQRYTEQDMDRLISLLEIG